MWSDIFNIDWQKMFVPSTAVLEIFLRGTLTYLAIVFILRVMLKRESGGLGMSDVLIIVLLGDASQNAMAGNFTSITDGIVLIATIIFWSFTLDWLSYKFPWFERLMHPKRLCLIKDGKLNRQNMRREFITHTELMTQIHEQGVDDINQIKQAYIESDGRISVITKEMANEAEKAKGAPERQAS